MPDAPLTRDPAALRALAHPVRLRLLGLLRGEGPSTASRLAERLGLNSGATSYHLRNLAQHGFIVDAAEHGNGRERFWQAAHTTTRTEDDADTPEGRDAIDAFAQAIAVAHGERLQRAVEERAQLPREWWRTATMSDWSLRLRPEDAIELREQLVAVLDSFADREAPPGTAGAADMVYQLQGFPRPGAIHVDPA
jgi:predicted ArsR family transcriptional regulator